MEIVLSNGNVLFLNCRSTDRISNWHCQFSKMICGSSTYSTPRLKNLSVKRHHTYLIINSNYHQMLYCISSKHGTNISHRPFYPATQKQKEKAEALPCISVRKMPSPPLGCKDHSSGWRFCPISLVLTRYSVLIHLNEWETTTLPAVISIPFQP